MTIDPRERRSAGSVYLAIKKAPFTFVSNVVSHSSSVVSSTVRLPDSSLLKVLQSPSSLEIEHMGKEPHSNIKRSSSPQMSAVPPIVLRLLPKPFGFTGESIR